MYERMNIEDWKAKKKNDRDAVMTDQKQALQEVLQDGADLTAYLLGRGRLGSGITSGNAALVLKACPQATAVMSFDGWNQFGRRVSKGAVGISQLVRSGGYFTVGKVYDRSATYGNKPCPTVELQGDQLGKAVAVLTACLELEINVLTVTTHCEAALFDGYGPHSGDPQLRWDLWYLPDLPLDSVLKPGGYVIRGKALWYLSEILRQRR